MLNFDICNKCENQCGFYAISADDIVFVPNRHKTGTVKLLHKSYFAVSHDKHHWNVVKNRICFEGCSEDGRISKHWSGKFRRQQDVLDFESFKNCPYYTEHFILSLEQYHEE